MPDVNEDMFVPGEKVNHRPSPEDKADAFLEAQLREARRQQRELEQRYPYMHDGATVLGPDVSLKGGVLIWKGEEYVPREQVKALMDLRSICGIHCGALGELMYDAGIQMPENVLRLYLILMDELTLTIGALAESRPTVMPRLPKGME